MTDEKMLATYEALAGLTKDMLAAVAARDWEGFIAQANEQEALVIVLQNEDTELSREPSTVAKKRALLEQVLANQTEITALMIPWRSAVATSMQSIGAERRLGETYGNMSLAR
ncbi:MAG: hypothetical protein NVSMB6_31250 [Burkholderiaceae bacterium]